MCNLVTPQVQEKVITANRFYGFSIEIYTCGKFSVMITKLQNIIFSRLKITISVSNFKHLCNSIHELLNVFEDPAQRVYTIAKRTHRRIK